MIRDFIYPASDRTQSIIAQLRQRLLVQIMKADSREDAKKLGANANFLSMLVPFGVSI
jgi:hypothetical protein